MSVLYSIVALIILLGVIVLVHEFGHYVAARLMGVRVETFSFGFGKRLFGKKVGDTDFRVSLFPLGGYVKMAGEEEWDPDNLKPDEFMAKNRAQKIFILVAGPFMNLLLAAILFTIINLTGVESDKYKDEKPQVGFVETNSLAQHAGIQKGDFIKKVDGRIIPNWSELELSIGSNPGGEVTLDVERNGKPFTTKMKVSDTPKIDFGINGIYWSFKTEIDSVSKDTPASRAGFKPGDIVERINDSPIHIMQFLEIIRANSYKELRFHVKRGEKELDLKAIPYRVFYYETIPFATEKEGKEKEKQFKKQLPTMDFYLSKKDGKYILISKDFDTEALAKSSIASLNPSVKLELKYKGVIGVRPGAYSPTIIKHYALFPAMKKSISDIGRYTVLVFDSFRKMIVGKLSPKNLSGPMEIAKYAGRAMEVGFSTFVLLIAFISLQLGWVNLFPIPVLDGGHLLIFTLEAILRKEFSQKVKDVLMNIGFALLITLMAFVILNDIAKKLPNGWASFWPF